MSVQFMNYIKVNHKTTAYEDKIHKLWYGRCVGIILKNDVCYVRIDVTV